MAPLRSSLGMLLGLALAACGSDPDPQSSNPNGAAGAAGQSGDAGPGTDANPSSPTMARSGAARDPASGVSAATLQAVVDADNAFAFDLYAKVRAQSASSNAVMSPLSVSLALSMTYAGAQNTTAAQMAKTLHWDTPGLDVHGGHNALTQALESRVDDAFAAAVKNAQNAGMPAPSPSDFRLHVVNSVWGDGSYTWEAPFLDVLAKSYGTGVYLANFVNHYEAERVRINTWVSGETQNKINNLLPEGSLDEFTRMVLVNAMHLKFPWESPFRPEATAAGDFTKADGTTVSADFMGQQASFPYFEDDKAQIVSLPIVGGKVSVVIALPKGTLDAFEAGLDTAYWSAARAGRTDHEVQIKLPKFSFTTDSIKLVDMFVALGMVEPFDPDHADFYGMCKTPPFNERLFIASILHKAMMGIDENGVEAAAATAVIMAGNTSVPDPPIPMNVNRPFTVAIVDEPTGSLLFLGHIHNPAEKGNQ